MILLIPIVYGIYAVNHKDDIQFNQKNILENMPKMVPIGYAIILFGYIVFIVGMRKHIGDTSNYIKHFDAISSDFSQAWGAINWQGKEPGFAAFNTIFKCWISTDYTAWLMTIAGICGLLVALTIRKYSCDFFMSTFIFVSTGTFIWMLNGMRQFIAVSILFFCSGYIKDGKFFRFLIAVLIASSFHTSALMMIPIYFIVRCKPWSGRIWIYILIMIIISIFSDRFFGGVDDYFAGTVYEGYTRQFVGDHGVNPLRFLFYLIVPITAFIKRKEFQPYIEKNSYLAIAVNMSVVGTAIMFVGIFSSGIFIGRLPIYGTIFNTILIPYIIICCFKEDERRIVKFIVIAIYLAAFMLEPNVSLYNSEKLNLIVDGYKVGSFFKSY